MNYIFVLCLILVIASNGLCATEKNNSEEVPKGRSIDNRYRQFLACGLTRDASCFLDTGDTIVEEQINGILAQADGDVTKISGRSDDENSPSQLTKTIRRIFSEFSDLFRDTLSGFFKSARESDDEDEIEDEEDKKVVKKTVGEARKKKKKQKLVNLIKLIILGLAIKAKLTLLLKALSAALQVKFFLVALAGLILNAARFYLDLKKGHHPQKVIYYEHAQHQHHYEGDEDWGSSGPGGSYWGRSYDEEEKNSPQDLAYAKQKPIYKKNDDKSSSWFG